MSEKQTPFFTANCAGKFESANQCRRYIRLGLNFKQAAFAVKTYSSHPQSPASIKGDPHIIA
jgi:hypothetical protein